MKEKPTDHSERLRRQHLVIEAAQSVSDDPFHQGVMLLDAALALFAKSAPAKLSKSDRAHLKSLIPGDITDDLITERAMTENGAAIAIGSFNTVAKIVNDYVASSDVRAMVESDNKPAFQRPDSPPRKASKALSAAFTAALADGTSAFGVTALFLIATVVSARNAGLGTFQINRALMDVLDFNLKHHQPQTPQSIREVEDQAVASVMRQMGISEKEARSYLAHAKKMMRDGDPSA